MSEVIAEITSPVVVAEISSPVFDVQVGNGIEGTPVINGLTSTSTTSALSANQGRILSLSVSGVKSLTAGYQPENMLTFPYTYASGRADYGVTYTINSDNSIHCAGTPTEISSFYLCHGVLLPAGTYMLSGGKTSSIGVRATNTSQGMNYTAGASPVTFTASGSDYWDVRIRITTNAGTVNTDMYPMLALGSYAQAYSDPALTRANIRDDVDANTAQVAKNTENIATNTANISTNTGNISANTANISTNTGNISANTKNIAKNTEDIASNTATIKTNTADIAKNTTAVNKLQTDTDSLITLTDGYRPENMIGFPYDSMGGETSDGITFTINSDNSIHCVGTPTAISYFVLASSFKLSKGNYTLSGGQSDNIRVFVTDTSTGKAYESASSPVSFSSLGSEYYSISIRILKSAGAVSTDVFPMISAGVYAQEYSDPKFTRSNLRNDVDTNTTYVTRIQSVLDYPTLDEALEYLDIPTT